MHVAELWRFPVKSLRGESLAEAEITAEGIAGDRLVHARRSSGRVFTARTHSKLLGLQGALGADGVPTIEGVRWDDPAALAAVRAITEPDAELVYYDGTGPERCDGLPISGATDGGGAAVGVLAGARLVLVALARVADLGLRPLQLARELGQPARRGLRRGRRKRPWPRRC